MIGDEETRERVNRKIEEGIMKDTHARKERERVNRKAEGTMEEEAAAAGAMGLGYRESPPLFLYIYSLFSILTGRHIA